GLKEDRVAGRRAEQGTRPHAFYIGAHDATLDPLAARHDATYMRSERGANDARLSVPLAEQPFPRVPPAQPARVAYDVPRQRAWGWPVSSYIWTKGVAAGLGILTGFAQYTNLGPGNRLLRLVSPVLALVFLGLTGALLVGDLKRPE